MFFRIGNILHRVDDVERFSFSTTAQDNTFFVAIYWKGKTKHEATLIFGQAAIDLAMRYGPQVLEGNREFKFARNAWIFHNLIAHPLMQILALLGFTKLGLRIHDATIPRPKAFV